MVKKAAVILIVLSLSPFVTAAAADDDPPAQGELGGKIISWRHAVWDGGSRDV